MKTDHEDYLIAAFDEAYAGMRANKGGPFGAVIVRNGSIIGRGSNLVTSANDPTAHAEIVAIRDACCHINHFSLADTAIYCTCEPCPMCLAAIFWAGIKDVFYCSSRNDAGSIGFSDEHIYDQMGISQFPPTLHIERIILPAGEKLFAEWSGKQDKTHY